MTENNINYLHFPLLGIKYSNNTKSSWWVGGMGWWYNCEFSVSPLPAQAKGRALASLKEARRGKGRPGWGMGAGRV